MAAKRDASSEAQWSKIAPLLAGKATDPGRTGSDIRLFVNGWLWVLCSGAYWCDLPERYCRWKSVHKRFSLWCHAGVKMRFEHLVPLAPQAVAALNDLRPLCGRSPHLFPSPSKEGFMSNNTMPGWGGQRLGAREASSPHPLRPIARRERG